MSAEIADELSRLSSLRERGIISAKGYESTKSQLVGGKHLRIAEEIEKLYVLLSAKTLTKKEFEKAVSALMFPSNDAGARAPEGKFGKKFLVRLVVGVGGLYLLHLAINLNDGSTKFAAETQTATGTGEGTNNASAQSNPVQNAQSDPIIPDQEARFVAINGEFRQRYKGSQNDLLKSTLVQERGKKLEAFSQDGSVSNWVGKVSKVDRVSGRWASLSVEIGDEVRIGSGGLLDNPDSMVSGILNQTAETLGSSERTEPEDGSFITADSSLYQTLLGLEVGQTIVFSGHFYPSDVSGLADSNLLEESSMVSPLYKFKFDSVVAR
ncbi:hypothetical protein P3C58_08655 [Mesorhizobium sp. XAP10]|uniref:hypothetical protein n=1 Tax=unclassified Mesorhizobium TaxID=325217 RepID=UPI0023DE70F9|nr:MULTISPECIES: hypothetical protein [unclassified Mesorhizobium]MDF3152045.1 hypothetical protein [Mesorhizobium sp. XAP10]MDF3244931.1 hypothetical protein [Mesorhizobium sp. XAP4]